MFKSFYFREQERYTPGKVAEMLQIDEAEARRICDEMVHASLAEYDVKKEYQTQPTGAIVIDYVGLAEINGYLLRFYPKYIKSVPTAQDMRLVLGAVEHYREESNRDLNNEKEHLTNMPHRLEQALSLLRDYMSNGLYYNENEKITLHGEAEIDWELTINTTNPILRHNKPYYFEYFTREMRQNETDFITQLHACILTECSRYVHAWELDDILDLQLAYLYHSSRISFGDDDYILCRLLQERRVQYNNRKQELLGKLIAWVVESPLDMENGGIRLFGTSYFHVLWEEMCRDVFCDQRKTPLQELGILLEDSYKKMKDAELLSLIPRPLWYVFEDGKTHKHEVGETLIPDFVRITRTQDNLQFLIIFDAKYYDLTLTSEHLSGQPGVEDVNKQFLYEKAYSDFREKHKLQSINAFLFPSGKSENAVIGAVQMPLFQGECKVVLISAPRLIAAYIDNKHWTLSDDTVIPGLFS